MADCYWHGYSGSPGPCHTCEIMDARGESYEIDTVTRCPCGSGKDANYCCPKEVQERIIKRKKDGEKA